MKRIKFLETYLKLLLKHYKIYYLFLIHCIFIRGYFKLSIILFSSESFLIVHFNLTSLAQN